ncbi:hypothetical protein ACHAXT_011006 [Thalassiosira profunda]
MALPFLTRPNKRTRAVAICWVAWFAYRVASGGYLAIPYVGQHILSPRGPRLIEGRIVHRLPVHGLHADGTDVEYRCRPGEVIHRPKAYRLWGGLNGTRQPLPHPLNRSGVLDFAIHISDMKLRALIVGNSLGEQLHAGLEEAMCYPIHMSDVLTAEDRTLLAKQSNCTTTYAENTDGQWIKEPRIVSTPSGGLLAVIKDNTNMIDTKTKWNKSNATIASLLQALGSNVDGKASKGEGEKLLDVFIYQFQSGHVDLQSFDEYYLQQVVVAASDLFRATTVIFPTIGWMNNVDSTRVDAWREANDRIRNFVRLYSPSGDSSVTSVQVLDIAKLSSAYIEANAMILGIPPNETYTLRVESRWESLAAAMCASLPFANNPRGCLPGMISNDGMHLCPETVHGRINAALVCLLDCKFNQQLYLSNLAACSEECNAKYMTLVPLAFSELKEEVILTG